MQILPETDTFPTTISGPEDLADDLDAVTVNTGLQDLASRTRYLNNRLGVFRLEAQAQNGSDASTQISTSAATTFDGTGDVDIIGGGGIGVQVTSDAIVTAHYSFDANVLAGADVEFQLAWSTNAGVTKTVIPGSRQYVTGLGTTIQRIHLHGAVTLGAVGTATLLVYLQMRVPAGTTTVAAWNPHCTEIRALQSNVT